MPRDLGFYDLTNEATLHAQAALARANGIAAFCFYHYWFDGKRLMERPLDLFVEAGVEQEFCLMWANENWTRTWDGLESEVLIEQTYREEDEAGFIADTARYMRDERYVRVAGRPLFIVYRPGLLPESRETLARWRRLWTEAVGAEPWLLMVQGFEDEDPRGARAGRGRWSSRRTRCARISRRSTRSLRCSIRPSPVTCWTTRRWWSGRWGRRCRSSRW